MNFEIKRISTELFVDFLEDYKEEVLLYFNENIFNDTDEVPYYSVIEEGEILAVFSLIQFVSELEITNCFVKPDRRKEGILTYIIDYSKKIAKLLDMNIVATTYINSSYSTFKKLGFEEVKSGKQDMIFYID